MWKKNLLSSNSSKKETKQFDHSTVWQKTKLISLFLEEQSAWKNHYDLVWPLVRDKTSLQQTNLPEATFIMDSRENTFNDDQLIINMEKFLVILWVQGAYIKWQAIKLLECTVLWHQKLLKYILVFWSSWFRKVLLTEV